ncbi:MAG TPA: phosphoribosyltransferase family protein [Candidatus Nanoarchaeia archaeon]|nr:phosphoribosyltransferase family protein [Candidatus Nanoarchaeia archaeon]
MVEKQFIQSEEFYLDSLRLGRIVLDSGYRPDFLVGLWRGGSTPGINVQEFLAYHGVRTDHIAIRTRRYSESEIDTAAEKVEVYGLQYIIERAKANSKVLFVDDVYDTGLTLQAVVEELKTGTANAVHDLKIATVYYKPRRNKTSRKPDFYIHETDAWLVFPHEFQGLTLDEIKEGKGEEVAKHFKRTP